MLDNQKAQQSSQTPVKGQELTFPSGSNADERQYVFEIVPNDPKYRYIWLCAESESDRKR